MQRAIAVAVTAPTPVHVVLAVGIAAKHVEGVARNAVSVADIIGQILDGTAVLQLVHHIFVPLGIGILLRAIGIGPAR